MNPHSMEIIYHFISKKIKLQSIIVMKMKKTQLQDIADVFTGLSYRRYLDNDGDKFKIIVQRSIKKDGIFNDFEEVNLKTNIKKRYFTEKNDILMKIPYPNNVVCVKNEGLVIGDRIAIIRVNNDNNADFITHLLTNEHIKKQLYENDKMTHTSIKQIKQLELIIPDLKTQEKYGELLNTINEKIIQDKKQVKHDQHLKEAILNNLWGIK